MLPTIQNIEILEDFSIERQPNFTYRMLIDAEQIVGDVDGLAAIEQAIYKILNTERYEFPIYSWNYGVELADLFGKPIPFVYSELPRRIREALLHDDRIEAVIDFELSHKKNEVLAKFKVVTVQGVLELSKEVKVA